MTLTPNQFWHWFRGFAGQLPGDVIPDELQDELLSQLQQVDDRLYFLMATCATPKELIITADGNVEAFPSADALVAEANEVDGWQFFALKPPMGFAFRFQDGPIDLDVSQLWFMPLKSAADPAILGVRMALPDVDFVLKHQSVDAAYTILESALGERAVAEDIAHVEVTDLPPSPADDGYLELPQLAAYVEFHKRQHQCDEDSP